MDMEWSTLSLDDTQVLCPTHEIVDKESSGVIVVIQVSYYLTETSMFGYHGYPGY